MTAEIYSGVAKCILPLIMLSGFAFTSIRWDSRAIPINTSRSSAIRTGGIRNVPVYLVPRLKKKLTIDGDWNKAAWKDVKEISISNFMGKIPSFQPAAKVKMLYDKQNIYMIFKVEDRHVRIQVENINGPVSGDGCVEFFFSPDLSLPSQYFNLEINAGGVPLFGYHPGKTKQYTKLDSTCINRLEIAHSLPKKLSHEISEPVTWTLECRIPCSVLEKYGNITRPGSNVVWRANFYKTSSRSSNPHWITWASVDSPVPNFHLPESFGIVKFK